MDWKDMTACERTLMIGRRHEIAKIRNPELRRGYNGRGNPRNEGDAEPFLQSEAKFLGCSPYTVRNYLRLYRKLRESFLINVHNTSLDKFQELRRLANVSESIRERAIDHARPRRKVRKLELV